MLATIGIKLHYFCREYHYHMLLSFFNDGKLSVGVTHAIFLSSCLSTNINYVSTCQQRQWHRFMLCPSCRYVLWLGSCLLGRGTWNAH